MSVGLVFVTRRNDLNILKLTLETNLLTLPDVAWVLVLHTDVDPLSRHMFSMEKWFKDSKNFQYERNSVNPHEFVIPACCGDDYTVGNLHRNIALTGSHAVNIPVVNVMTNFGSGFDRSVEQGGYDEVRARNSALAAADNATRNWPVYSTSPITHVIFLDSDEVMVAATKDPYSNAGDIQCVLTQQVITRDMLIVLGDHLHPRWEVVTGRPRSAGDQLFPLVDITGRHPRIFTRNAITSGRLYWGINSAFSNAAVQPANNTQHCTLRVAADSTSKLVTSLVDPETPTLYHLHLKGWLPVDSRCLPTKLSDLSWSVAAPYIASQVLGRNVVGVPRNLLQAVFMDLGIFDDYFRNLAALAVSHNPQGVAICS